jgi:hypothetical protein
MTSAVIDSPLPSLWLDWCEVTGTPPDRYADLPTLTRFTRHARPSRAVLNGLGRLGHDRPSVPHHASAWPAGLHLQGTLRQISHIVARPAMYWSERLRLRRLAFVAVLIAPNQQSGLGLPRRTVRELTPARFAALRSDIGEHVTPEPDGCAACATWEWLEVLGTNNGWSQASVRSLGQRYSRPSGLAHVCAAPDLHRDWLDCAAMVPHIDRWGWIDPWNNGLHPSSLSVLIGQLQQLDTLGISTAAGRSQRLDDDDDAHSPAGAVSPEEEQQILRRADEHNRRVQQMLREYGG